MYCFVSSLLSLKKSEMVGLFEIVVTDDKQKNKKTVSCLQVRTGRCTCSVVLLVDEADAKERYR